MRSLAVMVLLGACVSSNAVVCDDGRVCPSTKLCDDTHKLCVNEQQLADCKDQADRTECALKDDNDVETPGTCHEGVCLEAFCGNGRLDLVELETCDDGQTLAGDGCSVDCQSKEVCGNGITDLINPSHVPEQCDDANQLSHDGCADTCIAETLSWTPTGTPLPQHSGHATYDVARNTVLVMGGYTGNTLFTSSSTETTEWNGIWRGNIVTPPPTLMNQTGLAYDLEHRHSVRYGGEGTTGPSGETWSWDGVRWTRGPDGPKRSAHAMAYDPKRKRVVVFGGRDQTAGSVDTTLELDGTTWNVVTPTVKPAARVDALMTYDAKRGKLVMIGGGGASEPNGAVWEYDGTWTRKDPAGVTPIYRSGMAMAYDPVSTHVMLYGGSASPVTDEQWMWNGTTWTQFLGARPSARRDAVLAYAGGGRMLLFGGRNAGSGGPATVLSDTWMWDGAAWSQVLDPTPLAFSVAVTAFEEGKELRYGGGTSASIFTNEVWERTRKGWKQFVTGNDPPVRQFPGMVYDSARKQFVLFGGGLANNTADNTLYRRAGSVWSAVPPVNAPAGRVLPIMAYDAARRKTIVYGGVDASFTPIPDMWSWDGAAWASVTPAHLPPATHGAAAGYDPIREQVVIFGGGNVANRPVDQTWVWDGVDWFDATPATSPAPVLFAQLVWNPARRALTLAGPGFSFLDQTFETWEWVGAATSPPSGTWRRVETSTRPSNRIAATVAALIDGTGIDVNNGLASDGTVRRDGLELVSRGPVASDSCLLPFDADGDSLIGCADPDCWPTCSPACPPGVTCPATAPKCGDGVCSAGVETCQTCAGDCTCSAPICGDFVCDPGETQCPGDC